MKTIKTLLLLFTSAVSFSQATEIELPNCETVTTLVDNNDGTFTYTSEDGTITLIEDFFAKIGETAITFNAFRGEDCGTTFTGFNEIAPSAPIDVKRGDVGQTTIQVNDCQDNILITADDVATTAIGSENVIIGKETTNGSTVDNLGVYVGVRAGTGSTLSPNQVAIGANSASNATYLGGGGASVSVGALSLSSTTFSGNQVALGPLAMSEATIAGAFNIGSGAFNLYQSDIGVGNLFYGPTAGRGSTILNNNGAFGNTAFADANLGTSNYSLGSNAGDQTTAVDFNLYLGQQAGQYSTFGSQNVSIGISSSSGVLGTASTWIDSNVAIGDNSAYQSNWGSFNSTLGFRSGYQSTLQDLNHFSRMLD